MEFMVNSTKEQIEYKKNNQKTQRKEDSNYQKQIFEVYYFTILQYAIYSSNHKQITKLRQYYEKQGYEFNKMFSSAERQLNKIKNPEITLKPFINNLTTIAKTF